MFTGIIERLGQVKKVEQTTQGMRIWIECDFESLIEGESIAVDGICLTVIAPSTHMFQADLSPETIALTTASSFKKGSFVNLERSLTLQSRLGGHFVMGHVDTTCFVSAINLHADFSEITFAGLAQEHMAFFTKKGSVSVNGVSLTINQVHANGFSVMLIPHTLKQTNLHTLNIDYKVNIEFDYIARIVIKQMALIQETTL